MAKIITMITISKSYNNKKESTTTESKAKTTSKLKIHVAKHQNILIRLLNTKSV